MRSIPVAITWEMLRRGWWVLILGVLGANALPVLLWAGLKHQGALDPAEPSMLIMHVVLVQINLFAFGTSVFAALGTVSRLSTYPVPNSALVGWHMLLGMAAIGLEMVASTALLNAMFDSRWPIWGPAFFAAAMFAACQSALWLAEKSGWTVVTFGVAAISLALWFKSRCGPVFSFPNHYWAEVTPAEALFLAAVPILAYVVGIVGVARNRSGEPPFSIGLIDWLKRVFSLGPQANLTFRDPLHAQLWYEWRIKGAIMPAIVGMGLLMGLAVWLPNRNANHLLEELIAAGGLLAVAAALGGLIIGSVALGKASNDLQIGQFLATRPLTNTQLAGTVLRTAAKSIFLGWAMWAVAFLFVYAILCALHISLRSPLPAPVGWWYVPVVLLGAWTAAGAFIPVSLTGRPYLFLAVSCGGIMALFIGLMLFSSNVLSAEAQDRFVHGLAVFWGAAFAIWTVGAFWLARRRSLVAWPTLYGAAGVWIGLCALAAVFWAPNSAERITVYILIAGILALSVAPLATAPLALAWNRTR
jgi:hypothetical protein